MGDEVKHEPWMVKAAEQILETYCDGLLFRQIRNAMEATEGRRAGTDRDATQRTYAALAEIIAGYMPKPKLKPGDRVRLRESRECGTVEGQADLWDVRWDRVNYTLRYEPYYLVPEFGDETDEEDES